MTDILGRLGGLASMGPDVAIKVLAATIEALGKGTEFTGEQLAALGELQQRLADILRQAQGQVSGDDAG